MQPAILLQTIGLLFQCIAIIIAMIGFGLVLYQVRQAQKNAMMSSLISAVSNHWMLIEERRMKIRTGELKIHYPWLRTLLEKRLADKCQGDLAALANDFLWEGPSGVIGDGKEAVFDAIAREYAVQDLSFNLYEEEFLAGKYLKLTSEKLWGYWDFYLRRNFSLGVTRNHWDLRVKFGRVFPGFVEFVNQEYLAAQSGPKSMPSSEEIL